jgi:hypothetical protein
MTVRNNKSMKMQWIKEQVEKGNGGIPLTQVPPTCSMLGMEDYPSTLAELEARFSSEEACREYLFHLRWPNGFRCCRCGEAKAWTVRKMLYQCSVCGYQTSVIAGTIFEGTRKPLAIWFRVDPYGGLYPKRMVQVLSGSNASLVLEVMKRRGLGFIR